MNKAQQKKFDLLYQEHVSALHRQLVGRNNLAYCAACLKARSNHKLNSIEAQFAE